MPHPRRAGHLPRRQGGRQPGHQETWVDYDLDDRAPLLFIMGGKDHLMPPSVIRSIAKKYRNSHRRFSRRADFAAAAAGWLTMWHDAEGDGHGEGSDRLPAWTAA
ncbi:hypothetical protein [Streptomyces chartreusis]|uniref:hypothetical protein n=1 Tax=Streptomyces chartreusis TaxID=1969 RepID=UPI0033AC7653